MSGIDESREFLPVNIAIATISDTRTEENDTSGDLLAQRATDAGHNVVTRTIIKDEQDIVSAQFLEWSNDPGIDVVISTGGTGVTGRDITPEALWSMVEKQIPGFGELFRMISFKHVGTSALQSRACAGVRNGTYLFCLPGSPNACRDGWDEILHVQLDSRHRPCNFVQLLPRLKEK
jgi:molybdenum cofactor biosynthesis protein B